jgi:organic hydroperoxide reductase OsmC/OhrA
VTREQQGWERDETGMKNHTFTLSLEWEKPSGTAPSPRDPIRRRHSISHPDKHVILGSSAGAFHGEGERWNPEELLLASLAQCHMLTFFYLAQREGLQVSDYRDTPEATLQTHPDGSGNITHVTLKPQVTIREGFSGDIDGLHARAHELCFIARSVNFPVRHDATVIIT